MMDDHSPEAWIHFVLRLDARLATVSHADHGAGDQPGLDKPADRGNQLLRAHRLIVACARRDAWAAPPSLAA
jgi:hypothetical protein